MYVRMYACQNFAARLSGYLALRFLFLSVHPSVCLFGSLVGIVAYVEHVCGGRATGDGGYWVRFSHNVIKCVCIFLSLLHIDICTYIHTYG